VVKVILQSNESPDGSVPHSWLVVICSMPPHVKFFHIWNLFVGQSTCRWHTAQKWTTVTLAKDTCPTSVVKRAPTPIRRSASSRGALWARIKLHTRGKAEVTNPHLRPVLTRTNFLYFSPFLQLRGWETGQPNLMKGRNKAMVPVRKICSTDVGHGFTR